MPRADEWPKTVKRGALRGRTFYNQGEYRDALQEVAGTAPTDRAPRRARGVSKSTANGVTREMAAGVVQFGNIILAMVPQTRGDVLDDAEQEAIVLGILETARANKYFANLLVKACTLQSGSRLVLASAAVVARRVARHGLLPDEIAPTVEFGGAMLISMLAQDTDAAPVAVPESPNGAATEVPPSAVAAG